MNALCAFKRCAWRLVLGVFLGSIPCLAATTISQQINPPEINLGDSANVTITIQNGNASGIQLPHVDGIEVAGTSTQVINTNDNGAVSNVLAITFALVPTRAGSFTIPAFDITTQDGATLHVHEMNLHVIDSTSTPASSATAPASAAANPPFNPNGPVVMPPNNPAAANASGQDNGPANLADAGIVFTPPTDPSGRPAKVFLVVQPKTTDAFVGENILTRVEFYIRNDVFHAQDSLPTVDGSDFLMNDLSTRPEVENITVLGEDYQRFSWVTAIEAPKSGDFPLQMDQDTCWVKDVEDTAMGPNPILGQANLPSNRIIIHVHPLPEEGRPANFSGAVGQLKVSADAAPTDVEVGDPVTLHFTIIGEGNFSYIQCPTLATDPNWKAYVPSFRVEFDDESRTAGTKTFEQAIIPNKSGTLPLPNASFSYFDPAAKQYVTVPLPLPAINVTGSAPVVAASDSGASNANPISATTSPTNEFLPNRVETGAFQASLAPVYQAPWFWALQGGLILVLLTGGLMTFLRSTGDSTDDREEQNRRRYSLQQEESAMSEAVRNEDAHAFFLAARHAVQLQLGMQWHLTPEAITLAEIRRHDSPLAASLEPLFNQADEILYSTGTVHGLNLAQWEIRVRESLHQLQPA